MKNKPIRLVSINGDHQILQDLRQFCKNNCMKVGAIILVAIFEFLQKRGYYISNKNNNKMKKTSNNFTKNQNVKLVNLHLAEDFFKDYSQKYYRLKINKDSEWKYVAKSLVTNLIEEPIRGVVSLTVPDYAIK